MVFEKVKQIIINELGISPDKITLAADIKDDLGADSIEAVELTMALEDEFELDPITDEDAANIKTVGDLVKIIEAKLENK